MLEVFWLFNSCLGSLFLIYHIVHLTPTFYGTRTVIRHLIWKKYFYKINFVLLVVDVYDIYIMSNRPQILKTVGSVSFIVEKSLTVVLMFLINFLPR